ncbi:hypothetical protein SEA_PHRAPPUCCINO_48 [Mycobacterium phage Phrappuccino]|uniref:Uncharacterized protein n=1 Tax=Mycobacterium phage Phrappuccino TaxID=2591223 RepID=A0A514DDN2_9CAUD|nr:hypothetical protein KHQ87_gp048 [Mycobacterium phage Phrappuccino]QDH91723.1 hypothetical protein SEA_PHRAPPUCCINO_48 [Mycobacterium phage Phrappuccino]QIQ63166.1 hypothetical protein SEA_SETTECANDELA_48 [Mycobacterium phage Settecandela]
MEQFAKDLWGALREEIRSQLGDSITDEQFEEQVPPWDKLPKKTRDEKVKLARNETLKLIDRAGYEVRKKI